MRGLRQEAIGLCCPGSLFEDAASCSPSRFPRYLLLFFKGGCYLGIKSALLINLEEILSHANPATFISCIGNRGNHIHQGFIIAQPRHPLLYAAILDVFSTDPGSLNIPENYMMFCHRFWGILKKIHLGGPQTWLQSDSTVGQCVPVA